MPEVRVKHELVVGESFRLRQAADTFGFELPPPEDTEAGRPTVTTDFTVSLPSLEDGSGGWTVGAVVGGSMSGKSSVVRQACAPGGSAPSPGPGPGGSAPSPGPSRGEGSEEAVWDGGVFVEPDGLTWPADASLLDGFDGELSTPEVFGALGLAALNSPPDWVKPYRCLSTGGKFRATLARALSMDASVVAVDEFGSTVTAQVAQASAHAVRKAMTPRKDGRRVPGVRCRRFVAVGASGGDWLDWLQPDWVLDVERRLLARGWVPPGSEERKVFRGMVGPKPDVAFSVHDTRGLKDAGTGRSLGQSVWAQLGRHHYLSHRLHGQAAVYVALYPAETGEPVGLCAVMGNAGFKGYRRVTRLVVHPDYQGLGIGLRLLERVAEHEARLPGVRRVSIGTSHPALVAALGSRPPEVDEGSGEVIRSGWRYAGQKRQSAAREHSGLAKLMREGKRRNAAGHTGARGRRVLGFVYAAARGAA